MRPAADEGPAWFAVHTCHQYEAKVEADLRSRGLEVFVLRITVRSRRRDRCKLLAILLFSCYLFGYTKMNKETNNTIVQPPRSVAYVVGSKKSCTPIPADTVASIRSILERGKPVYPWPRLLSGCRLREVTGSLSGALGTLSRRKSEKHDLAAGVELLGQSLAVDLDEEGVEPSTCVLRRRARFCHQGQI